MIYSHLPEKALSIRQPWAWCILNAGKDIENRSRRSHLRGKFCIHASKGITKDEYEHCLETCQQISTSRPFPSGMKLPSFGDFVHGAIVGTAEIVDCVPFSDSPWFFGPYGYVLTNVTAIEPIPVKGALGFFDWRKNLQEANRAT